MKPSKEQVDAWHKTACAQANKQDMSAYYDEVDFAIGMAMANEQP